MTRRKNTNPTGRGVSTTEATKDGKAFSLVLDGDRFPIWLACFCSAIGGMVAAQRRTPNPTMIARWCARMADAAIREAAARQKDAA